MSGQVFATRVRDAQGLVDLSPCKQIVQRQLPHFCRFVLFLATPGFLEEKRPNFRLEIVT